MINPPLFNGISPETSEIIFLIVDLELMPRNEAARDFYDTYWSEVLFLEDSRQLLEYFHYRRLHPLLTRRHNVHKPSCNRLPFEDE